MTDEELQAIKRKLSIHGLSVVEPGGVEFKMGDKSGCWRVEDLGSSFQATGQTWVDPGSVLFVTINDSRLAVQVVLKTGLILAQDFTDREEAKAIANEIRGRCWGRP